MCVLHLGLVLEGECCHLQAEPFCFSNEMNLFLAFIRPLEWSHWFWWDHVPSELPLTLWKGCVHPGAPGHHGSVLVDACESLFFPGSSSVGLEQAQGCGFAALPLQSSERGVWAMP